MMATHETPWDLVAKILAWNKQYAAEAQETRRSLVSLDVPPPVPSTRLPGEPPADYDG